MKRKQLMKEIQDSLKSEMREAILDGWDWMDFEQCFGDATVHVKLYEVRLAYGKYILDEDIWIEHLNRRHESPLLEKAVKEILPDWFQIKMEVNRQIA